MAFDVNSFKGELKLGGARPNLFQAELISPVGGLDNFRFMCKAAQLPGSTIPSIDVPYFGRQIKYAGNRTFEPWTVTIINDTDFSVRDAMERWMNGINAHAANTGLSNPVDYEADLSVDQLDRNGDVLKTYNFRGCFPTNVSEIALSYETNDVVE